MRRGRPPARVTLVSDDGLTCDLVNAVGYEADVVQRGQSRASTSNSVIAEAMRRRDLVVVEPHENRAAESRVRSADELLSGHPGAIVVPLVASGRVFGAVAMSLDKVRGVDGDERALPADGRTAYRAGARPGAALRRGGAGPQRGRSVSPARRRRAAQIVVVVEEALRLSEAKYRALATRTSRLYCAERRAVGGRDRRSAGACDGRAAARSWSAQPPAPSPCSRDQGTAFEALYAEEYAPFETPPRKYTAEAGLCATAAATTRQAVFIGSFAEWQEKYPLSASIAADGGYASAATLPLLTEGRVIGVVSFYFTAPVNFDDEYRALLTSVAQHCAQALERAYLYEAAERARSDAEAANQSKDDFLSTISHELRTPLNAILGWAAMLRSGSVDVNKTQRALEAIFNNATRQGRLIEELLDVSRIVAGRAVLDLQEVDLCENIRGAVESMMPMAAGKGIELRFAPPEDIRVVADPRRLEQVFLNLLSNAVKFTQAGGRVTIEIVPAGNYMDIHVVDTGIGIDPMFLPHVFERFRQGNSTTTRTVGGLGLGLFIARHLVEAQEGSIRADSAGVDRGATFTVRLKAAARSAARQAAPSAAAPNAIDHREANPALDGIRVLLVDDEEDSREMMASALETCGATVVAAASAQEAMRALNRWHVDVMLSDIAMPEKDGYELIREIRSTSAARIAAVPAAAVTACVRDDERQKALDAGFQMHLAKPVHPAALARAVAALARRLRA